MPLTNQARLFEKWKTLSNEKNAIQCISVNKTYCAIHLVEKHLTDSVVLVKCWKVAHWTATKMLKIAKIQKIFHLNFKSCYLNVSIFSCKR